MNHARTSLPTPAERVVARLAPMSDHRGERGAAMIFAVLFMLLIGGISVVLLSVIAGQIAPSLSAQQGTRAGYSAQAGLQVGLGVIRTATSPPDVDGVVYGNPAELPCSIEGAADGDNASMPFEVHIRYFTLDPGNRTDAWLDANDITCVDGSGTSIQPRYALVTSHGWSHSDENDDFSRDRTMSAIYQFNLTNVNIPGGRIFNGARTHCLRAMSATSDARMAFFPVAQCTNDALELWSYDANWRLTLASTVAPNVTPLCIAGPTASPFTNTQDARLQACRGATDPARWNQLWSWVGGENWRGQRQTISAGISNYCLTPPTGNNITGGFLIARHNGCGSSMSPTPEVGAGAAGYSTRQIVNFRQFGRCADVTNESITHTFMIVYPCKQDPTGTGDGILWNHKWFYSEPAELQGAFAGQEIYVFNGNSQAQKRCLTTQPQASTNTYVVFAVCTGDARQKWTRVAQGENYENSWLFVDTFGRCLTAATNDLFNGQWARMTAVSCNGTGEQKWNAPPNSGTAVFGGYREIAN